MTLADDGQTIETSMGAALRLSLPAIAGTGYLWRQEPPLAEGVVVEEQLASNAAELAGGSLDQVFLLTPRIAGQVELRFALRRSWEEAAKPEGQFRVTLLIRP